MPNLIILGGTGLAGRKIAKHLLQCSNARVTLAARHVDQAQAAAVQLSGHFAGERVTAVAADASDKPSLQRAFAGHDLVIVASPTPAYAGTVIQACLDAGVDYLDIQLGAAKLASLRSRAADIQRAGLCFVTEAGFHPGLPSVLVRLAASHLDPLQRAAVGGYINMGRGLPYSEAVDELVDLFKAYDNRVYQNSQWVRPGFFETRLLDFGGDLGPRRSYPMFFEELHDLPETIPSLEALGFYVSESHWVTDWLITPLVMLSLRLVPNAVRPIGRLLWWGMSTFHKPPYRVELMVEAHGKKDGEAAIFRASVAHPDGYELTAIPVVASLLQVLDGSARRRGLWMMGHLVDPARLMQDMASMGAQVAVQAS
jgi:saccharopine dehydrogenase-like NADP-dependent oxidoreductase